MGQSYSSQENTGHTLKRGRDKIEGIRERHIYMLRIVTPLLQYPEHENSLAVVAVPL
jgi:hypothetical protein